MINVQVKKQITRRGEQSNEKPQTRKRTEEVAKDAIILNQEIKSKTRQEGTSIVVRHQDKDIQGQKVGRAEIT